MDMSIFEKFNQQTDLEGLKQDIEEASSNSGEFKKVPHGMYEVDIVKMELVETEKPPARPMLTIWFRILDGEYKGQRIFMNQLLTKGYPILIAIEFLRSLESGIDVKFEDYVQFAHTILSIFESIEEKKEYALEYGVNNKGYDQFTIKQVFEV